MIPLIGILGGSGPEAGLYITHLLHQYLQENYNVIEDGDYPDYILYNKPLEGFGVTGVLNEDLVIKSFKEAVDNLINMGANIIGVACNTLHLYREHLKVPKNIILCNLIESCIKEIENNKGNVLILSSETTNTKGLYSKKLAKSVNLSNKDQIIINNIIQKVMGNNHGELENELINELIIKYKYTHNIKYVIMGCTELPLAFSNNKTNILVVNSNHILAKTLVETYNKLTKKNKNSNFIN